jgi:hypothetical protein
VTPKTSGVGQNQCQSPTAITTTAQKTYQLLTQYITRTMAYEIAFSPPPRMELLSNILREEGEAHDTWITEEPLYSDRCVPGIPAAYKREQEEERAVYVKGIPHEWQNRAFKVLVANFGEVENVPFLISFGSEHIFRWAIMATAEEAANLLNGMHGMKFEGEYLTTSMATPPGRTVHLLTPFTQAPSQMPLTPPYTPFHSLGAGLGAFLRVPTVHGHPSPASSLGPKEKTKENIPPVTQDKTLIAKARSMTIPKEFTPSPRAPEFAPVSAATTTSKLFALSCINDAIDVTEKTPSSHAVAAPVTAAPFVPISTSWANIASAANPSTSIVELHPTRPVSSRLQPVGRIPSVVRSERHNVVSAESQSEQMRVVFLLNLPNNLTLQDVSNGVQEGPLVQIAFGFDELEQAKFAGVVFQYARDAEVFHQVLLKERAESRPERFRFIVDAVRGDPFPADEAIKAMGDPKVNASRRLTMVKKGFFFVFGERHLMNLCNKVVGEEDVQLVWLYNGGNATVVFSNVRAAMKMKAELDRLTAGAGLPGGQPAVWAGLQTTYSKDPCHIPLVLTSAINN